MKINKNYNKNNEIENIIKNIFNKINVYKNSINFMEFCQIMNNKSI